MNSGNVDNASYKTTIEIGAGKLKQVCWYLVNACIFKSALFVSSSLKVFLLRLFGAKIETGVVIKPSVNIKYPWKLSIGRNTWIGENVWLDNVAFISIGNNVCISQGAVLITGNHNYKKASFDLILAAIHIEDGVWVGAKAIVCPGTVCASHAVISAGAVVSGNIEAFTIYKGNPAQKTGVRVIN